MAADLADRVRAFVAELNTGDLVAIERHIDRDFYEHRPGQGEPTAPEAWLAVARDLRAGLPDLAVTIDELGQGSEGADLGGRITLSGTHTGGLWGAPPSNARVEWPLTVSIRDRGDRFAVNFDGVAPPEFVGVLRQLELVNPPDEMHLPTHHRGVAIPEFVLRLAFTGMAGDRACSHLDRVAVTAPSTDVCAECVESGDIWPQLRMCLVCGYVGCCDTAVNKHMKAHHEATGHPLFRSIHGDDGWIWCYEDSAFFSRRVLERLP